MSPKLGIQRRKQLLDDFERKWRFAIQAAVLESDAMDILQEMQSIEQQYLKLAPLRPWGY